MSAVRDDIKAKIAFVNNLIERLQNDEYTVWIDVEENLSKNLSEVVAMLDTLHAIMHEPSITLEQKIEERLTTLMEQWSKEEAVNPESATLATLWLLQRRVVSIGRSATLRGISSLIGSFLVPKSKDPH